MGAEAAPGAPAQPDALFTEPWMANCAQQVNFPNPACQKVLEKVNQALASRVKGQLSSEAKQQALFSLLGKEFVRQHFPHHKFNTKILEPPKMAPAVKEKHLREMRAHLKAELGGAMRDCGYPENVGDYRGDDELGTFVSEVKGIFSAGLQTEIGRVMDEEKVQSAKVRKERDEFRDRGSDEADTTDTDDEEELGKRKKKRTRLRPSDVAGRALLTVLAKDPAQSAELPNRLKGQFPLLSRPLRRHVWLTELLSSENKRHVSVEEAEPQLMAAFKQTLTKRTKEQKGQRANRSPQWKLIDNVLIEAYDRSLPLRPLDCDDHLILAAQALNVLNTYDKGFTHTQAYWLCPLQLAIETEETDTESYVIQLALYLDLLLRHCKPSTEQLFKLADRVIENVKSKDPEYHRHLQEICRNRPKVVMQDFIPEVLHKDHKTAVKQYNEMLDMLKKGKELSAKQVDMLSDPKIFIRKWLVQCFVGILSVTAQQLLWDQLFLRDWNRELLFHAAVAVLHLIRPWMMRATSYSGAKKVFLEEPGKLYTLDVRKAFMHLVTGGKYSALPENKNYISPPTPAAAPREPSPPRRERKTVLPPVKDAKPASPPRPRFMPVNINLDDDDDEEEVKPKIEPLPDSASSSSEDSDDDTPPPHDPTPPPRPPAAPEDGAWCPHDRSQDGRLPEPTPVTATFDLYIDSVRFIPDNAVFCKVTGRVFNFNLGGEAEKLDDILAYPLHSSNHRCPRFNFRMALNKDRVIVNHNMVIMLRIYCYEESTNQMVVAGTTLLAPFDSAQGKPVLRVGGHQQRIRVGLPSFEGGVANLMASDMDSNPTIPGLTILYRLLPHTESAVDAPEYSSGYYQSASCEPGESETRLFRHYLRRDTADLTVGEWCRRLQERQRTSQLADGPNLQKWMETMLESKKEKDKDKKAAVPDLDLQKFIHYDIEVGANVMLEQAFGLPAFLENRFTLAMVEYLPGKATKDCGPAGAGRGDPTAERFVTQKLDINSLQRSPNWTDPHTTLHPHYDGDTVLLVRLFSLPLEYRPGGTVRPRDGDAEPELQLDRPAAWTLLQLFDSKSVFSGTHAVPLLMPPVNSEFLELAQRTGAGAKLFSEGKSKELITPHDGASLEVTIWDGTFSSEECPPIQRYDSVLAALQPLDKYNKHKSQKAGPPVNALVFENMTEKQQQEGVHGDDYIYEKQTFETAMVKKFNTLLNKALVSSGEKKIQGIPEE
ncbi:uncharacterized protein LOC122365761 [Amphibalanus amphitrite]|uniref:uncharacterized protein LOC122365761 n=1 Tax=Amphibalanus amphitrite TaxID=1232801 RepID=UPI001C911CF4|nr:uncharacterized protein LOC122365761 [Amphibalanus amphitrite]